MGNCQEGAVQHTSSQCQQILFLIISFKLVLACLPPRHNCQPIPEPDFSLDDDNVLEGDAAVGEALLVQEVEEAEEGEEGIGYFLLGEVLHSERAVALLDLQLEIRVLLDVEHAAVEGRAPEEGGVVQRVQAQLRLGEVEVAVDRARLPVLEEDLLGLELDQQQFSLARLLHLIFIYQVQKYNAKAVILPETGGSAQPERDIHVGYEKYKKMMNPAQYATRTKTSSLSPNYAFQTSPQRGQSICIQQ